MGSPKAIGGALLRALPVKPESAELSITEVNRNFSSYVFCFIIAAMHVEQNPGDGLARQN